MSSQNLKFVKFSIGPTDDMLSSFASWASKLCQGQDFTAGLSESKLCKVFHRAHKWYVKSLIILGRPLAYWCDKVGQGQDSLAVMY